MKKLLITLSFLLFTVVASAGKHSSPGYWYSSNGTLIKTDFGHCVRTSLWSKDNALKACDPHLFPVEEVVDEKMPAQAAKPVVDEKPVKQELAPKTITIHDVLFAYDHADLNPNAVAVLNEVAAFLKDQTKVKVAIHGHTDSDGNMAYNQKLGLQRAESVRSYLVGQGIDSSRMTVKSYGESVPVADNITDAGKAQNRRVEFVLDYGK